MKRLHFQIPHNLSLLHQELLDSISTVAPILNIETNELEAVMRVEGDSGNVWLTVPDDVDESAVQAIVDAHDANATTAKEEHQAKQDVLEAKLTDDSITFEEMKELMRLRG